MAATSRRAFPLPGLAGRCAARVLRTMEISAVHFAPSQMWYSVDDEQELITIVDQLLLDEVLFVRTTDATGAWAGTTLGRRIQDLELNEGETATLLSWSGSRDQTAG